MKIVFHFDGSPALAAKVAALGAELCAESDEAAFERLLPDVEVLWHVLKPVTAILVNTARGGLIDERKLVIALTTRHLPAAGLDVFASEPLAASHPLPRLENVVLAPHLAWLTQETLGRSVAAAMENVARLREHRPLANRVA